MDKLRDLFKYMNRRQFLIDYAKLDPDGGINHRIINRPTNYKDKKIGLTESDKVAIKDGLKKLIGDINDVIETL